jgi:hypothetical protein
MTSVIGQLYLQWHFSPCSYRYTRENKHGNTGQLSQTTFYAVSIQYEMNHGMEQMLMPIYTQNS